MSKISGQHAAILFDGYDISGRVRQFDVEVAYDEDDTTAFLDSVVNSEPGLQNTTANATAFFDPAAAMSLPALSTPGATAAKQLLFLFGAGADPKAGDRGIAVISRQFKMSAPIPSKGKLTLEAAFKAGSQYSTVFGHVLDYAAVTNSRTGTGVDRTAANADGAVAYLMVLTPASSDSYEFKMQDSPDNSAWSDFITFTLDGQSRAAERITEASSVDRYWRVICTRTGAAGDSMKYAVVAAKL